MRTVAEWESPLSYQGKCDFVAHGITSLSEGEVEGKGRISTPTVKYLLQPVYVVLINQWNI